MNTGSCTDSRAEPEKDTVTNWAFELGSPNTLIRYGWYRDTLKVGEEVVVDGYRARNGGPLVNAKTVKFSDGRMVSAGSAAELTVTR